MSKKYLSTCFLLFLIFCGRVEKAEAQLFLTGGFLANQHLSAEDWIVYVDPGDPIYGNVIFDAFHPRSGPGVIVPMGYTWTWGDNRITDIVTVSGNIPQSTSTWNVPIDLAGPMDIGTYYLLFGARGEFNMQQVMSSTNWQAGGVVWHDGNDFVDMDDDTLFLAHDNGYVEDWPLLTRNGYATGYGNSVMPIKIIVHGESSVIPEPASMLLFGCSLIGVGFVRKNKL